MTGVDETAVADPPAGGGPPPHGTPRPPCTFALFADGTGNAFTTQESNVWRLYEALDRTRPDQVAYYIKGVGTSGWRPLAALDGATGIGVPSNVRKLYRFLCWNWQPGDKIYIFGFSRGAFTARTLAGLIASQGLVPSEIGGSPVSRVEMARNAMAAWRTYRSETAPSNTSLPTIAVTRVIRDLVLAAYHRLLGHRSYAAVRGAMAGRDAVEIEFLGLFDTVEAFGVPIEELRTAIDFAIWPISFRNRQLSDKVLRARHALALDDERTSFHPIRIDHPEAPDDEVNPRVREVWFAGVHSDVGGGYPDGSLSHVPLAWMAEQVEHELRFQNGRISHFKAYQSAIGPRHDSRSGAAVMYRYGPRPIETDKEKNGGPPIVHLGVVERMLHGCDDYAPIMLPASAKVRLPSGKVMPITEQKTRVAMKTAYQQSATAKGIAPTAAADAFTAMKPPDADMVELTLDTVWWRRFAYFALLATIALAIAWPWIAIRTVAKLKAPADQFEVDGTSALDLITLLDNGVGAIVGPLADLVLGFLPSYAEPWLRIIVYYPFASTVVLLLLLIAWHMNNHLLDRVQERARLAWKRPQNIAPEKWAARLFLPVGRFFRLHGRPVRFAFAKLALPGIFLIAIFGAVLLTLGRSYYNWRAGTGDLCSSAGKALVGEQPVTASSAFDTASLCWGSGLWVEKGRKYRIWIDAKDAPWFDRTIMSGVNGFQLYDWRHLLGLPLRRWYKADWFQPVLRIGKEGYDEQPLGEINAMPADALPRAADPTVKDGRTRPIHVDDEEVLQANGELRGQWTGFGAFEPIPAAALPAAREVWRRQGLTDRMVADFVAAATGEVFLYVNDAVMPVPTRFALFYGNNSGAAQVTLQRIPLPAAAAK